MPKTFTAAQRTNAINTVLAGLRAGTPLAVICRGTGMPNDDTIRMWAASDADLARSIACARVDGFDAIADRMRATVRGKTSGEGGESTGDVARDKLIAETDLKLLAKWDPKRYGDSVRHAHSGPNGGPIEYRNLSDEEVEARIRAHEAGDGDSAA